MGPVNPFLEILKNINWVNNPISEGIVPFKPLLDKSSNVKPVSKPISVGMDPVKREYFPNPDDTSEVVNVAMGNPSLT